jgi:hypothetical protein
LSFVANIGTVASGEAMKMHWALLTIVASLGLGIATAELSQGGVARTIHTMFGCMFLHEAEAAGYLDKAKRAALVDQVASDPVLDARARASAATMRTTCAPHP